jgi:hypothetical protein
LFLNPGHGFSAHLTLRYDGTHFTASPNVRHKARLRFTGKSSGTTRSRDIAVVQSSAAPTRLAFSPDSGQSKCTSAYPAPSATLSESVRKYTTCPGLATLFPAGYPCRNHFGTSRSGAVSWIHGSSPPYSASWKD